VDRDSAKQLRFAVVSLCRSSKASADAPCRSTADGMGFSPTPMTICSTDVMFESPTRAAMPYWRGTSGSVAHVVLISHAGSRGLAGFADGAHGCGTNGDEHTSSDGRDSEPTRVVDDEDLARAVTGNRGDPFRFHRRLDTRLVQDRKRDIEYVQVG
jgi:hypothetical protein